MSGGLRWDSVPRMVGGVDRSLVGGISWNVAGGSLAAFKSKFVWAGAIPTDVQLQNTIDQAFSFWTSVDPNPQLNVAAPFWFVYSPGIAATDDPKSGAEIDLLADDLGFPGSAGGALSHPILSDHVTLTSGTSNYGSDVIGGVDIFVNNHAGTTWTLLRLRALLAHEFGHALGMGHASLGLPNRYIDDDYDGASQATANATLTNHFSHLINPLGPSDSPLLTLYTVPNSTLGTNASDVHILMERFLDTETINAANPLSADDYAQRQFLYPVSGQAPSADFDGDGNVDGNDLRDYWMSNFGTGAGADADGDGDSDGVDFLVWQRQLGKMAEVPAPSSAVPEPATIFLVVATASLGRCRRQAVSRGWWGEINTTARRRRLQPPDPSVVGPARR